MSPSLLGVIGGGGVTIHCLKLLLTHFTVSTRFVELQGSGAPHNQEGAE